MIPIWTAVLVGVYAVGVAITASVMILLTLMGRAFGMTIRKKDWGEVALFSVFWFVLVPAALTRRR